ncbi:MAG: ISL3 family transposase [Actinobacteria bacterium]|nr:ISL3 family transposase [Actinomycetota bacterium]MCA1698104.1 ISL3 family transposase [Actinomycetota bacterium]
MRVTTAFNRLLGLPGASVIDVGFGGEGVIVTVRLRRRRRVCARCGQTGPGLTICDRRVKRWRHLDLGSTRCVIECELRLLRCPDCRVVRAEPVPWARPGAHHTRDFEDVIAWLAQQMAKTPIAGLMRIGWDTVGRIVERVVGDHLDDSRLDGLVAIGCDEISYRRGQRYLTSVVDHRTGAIVWCSPGRNAQTLQAFFDELGPRRRESIRAVSIDMSGSYAKAIRDNVPRAEICFDPFHIVRLAQRAVDQVRRHEWNAHDRSRTKTGKWIKGTRWSLLKAPDKQSVRQLALLGEVAHANNAMFRAFLMKEELRVLYQLKDPALAPAHFDAWLAWASRSRLRPFVKLARTIRRHRDGILAAIRLGLSNGRLEGLNSRIRLISHRSFGFHSAQPLIALVYLCCSGIVIDLPR